jgi:hypothetical protein
VSAAADRGRSRSAGWAVVVLLVAGVVAFLVIRADDSPKLSPAPARQGDAADVPPDGGVAPIAVERASNEGEGGGAGSSSGVVPVRGSEGGSVARVSVATGPTKSLRIEGALVDEHARLIDEEQLFAAVAGEVPRIWLTQAGRRLAEFWRSPGGNLWVDLEMAADRSELRAETRLAGRTFATFLDPELREPFTLRVELSALALDSSAVTVVVRPAPTAEELRDRFVVLFRDAERRASWIDGSGLARFSTLAAGSWEGVVCISGELPVEFAFELGERDDRDVLVELRRGFRIRGEAGWSDLVAPLPPCVVVATRIESQEPVADARRPRLQGGVAHLGGDGSFVFEALPAGRWRLELLRVDREPQSLHEEVVTTGLRDVETVTWRIVPPKPPARSVRFLFAWPGDHAPEPAGNLVIPRALVATFFGAGATVVGRGLLDPDAKQPPQLPLPEGATVVELAWRDLVDGRLLDSGVPVTRVALPRVVQSGATQHLKVTFAAVPRD